MALIAIVPVFVMLPWIVRAPPFAGSARERAAVRERPDGDHQRRVVAAAVSPFVSVIEPALVKLAAAVVVAFSPLVLSIDSDWPGGHVAAQRARSPRSAIELAPEPV